MISLSNIKKEQNNNTSVYIDLNCDIGQSYGIYRNESELDLLDYVSSVNIACGAHAGDPLTIMNAFKHAKEHNLSIGAHIGYPDIQGFGYRPMELNTEELQAVVLYQIGAISAMAKVCHVEIEHVRLHGALYKQAAQNFSVMSTIAETIAKYNPWIVLVGAAGENLAKAGEANNIRIAHELFLDKVYNHDGTIDFDAQDVINLDYSAAQLNSILKNSTVKNNQNGFTKVEFNTIHLNLKSQISVEIAKMAREVIANPVPIAITLLRNEDLE